MIRLVEVVPYDPGWNEHFQTEAAAITNVLPEVIVNIHHIGSTAVPGLCAKPIIDILAVISNQTWQEEYTQVLEGMDYIARERTEFRDVYSSSNPGRRCALTTSTSSRKTIRISGVI